MFLVVGVLSCIGFLLMGLDKWKARRSEWRIPEKVFWTVSLFGGVSGCTLGMYIFRHKTKHPQFYLGLPIMTFIQWWLIFRFL